MSGTEQAEESGDHAPSAGVAVPAHLPRSLGKYRFVATLGHGGMAEVFLAVGLGPAGFNKLQVIKRLRPHLAEDPDLCAMFLAEARLAARLNHRNVVQTNEVDFAPDHEEGRSPEAPPSSEPELRSASGGQYFMVMEYLDGQPLHRILAHARRAGRALSLSLVSRVVCDLLAGLHYAHELADYDGTPLGVVHRDVSPQNVFVTYDGQVTIVDFGIAKAARRAVQTASGVIKGKVAYMAPEQAFGEVDRRADVFSAGVVLWELLADRRLWHDRGDPEILAALAAGVPLLRDRPAVDPPLQAICERALALDRDQRYPSAAALRADLERAAPPCSAEDLGAFVEALFHEHRRSIRAALARQVDSVAHGDGADLLQLDRLSLRPPSQRPRGAATTGGLVRSPRPPPTSEAPTSAETPAPSTLESRIAPLPPLPSFPFSSDEDAAPRAGDTSPSPPARAPSGEHHPTAHARPGRAPLLVSGLLVIGALVVLSRNRAPAGPPAPAMPPPTAREPTVQAVVAPSAVPAGAYLYVHLGASPAEARILIDGAPLPSNPFDGKFMKDGAVHRIQVEAGGFLSQSRLVVFDRDHSVDLALLPRPRPQREPGGGGGSVSAPEHVQEPPGMKPDPYR